jgi:hypothetical protein
MHIFFSPEPYEIFPFRTEFVIQTDFTPPSIVQLYTFVNV